MPRAAKRKTAASSSLARFRLTHPDRVVYADQGITKIDLAMYYAQVTEWILPHVFGRPLSIVRCPAGTSGACFFQKHPPQGLPEAVERFPIREKDETEDYQVIHDLEGLIALVQFGAMEIHTWGATTDDIERPDRLVFDLDPAPDVAWPAVVEAAHELRDLLSDEGLTTFVKTTGGKGLHLVAPIRPEHPWKIVKPVCKALAERLAERAPDRFTTNMAKAARKGKIFIDYLRNDRGATSVAPYSTRAKAGAPVSTPVTWRELSRIESPQAFTLQNIPQRLTRLRKDPWGGMSTIRQRISV